MSRDLPMDESQQRAGGAGLLVLPVPGLPEVRQGDDVAALLLAALTGTGAELRDGDVLVVSAKVISKSAGLRVPLAQRVAAVLAASRRVVAERLTATSVTRVVESTAGPVLVAAGIDASNTGDGRDSAAGAEGGSTVLLLPPDPDAHAARLRASLAGAMVPSALLGSGATPIRLGVILSDTAGRPWRHGQTDFALGCAGLVAVDDLRGQRDADGRELHVTATAVADEIASAADLVRPKNAGIAAALVRGVPAHVVPALPADGPGAPAGRSGTMPEKLVDNMAEEPAGTMSGRSLIRTGESDWFALGHVEAVRAALGVAPGTAEAMDIGVAAVGPEPAQVRLERAVALALHDRAVVDPPAPAPGAPPHPRAHLLTRPLRLGAARADIVQAGIRVEAPDDLTLAVALARLLVAVESEGLSARLASHTPAAPGRPPQALVVLV